MVGGGGGCPLSPAPGPSTARRPEEHFRHSDGRRSSGTAFTSTRLPQEVFIGSPHPDVMKRGETDRLGGTCGPPPFLGFLEFVREKKVCWGKSLPKNKPSKERVNPLHGFQ